MIGRAGHSHGAVMDDLGLPELVSPVLIVASWLQSLSASGVGIPTTGEGLAHAAALLIEQFEMQGWPLSDMESGAVLVFAASIHPDLGDAPRRTL